MCFGRNYVALLLGDPSPMFNVQLLRSIKGYLVRGYSLGALMRQTQVAQALPYETQPEEMISTHKSALSTQKCYQCCDIGLWDCRTELEVQVPVGQF